MKVSGLHLTTYLLQTALITTGIFSIYEATFAKVPHHIHIQPQICRSGSSRMQIENLVLFRRLFLTENFKLEETFLHTVCSRFIKGFKVFKENLIFCATFSWFGSESELAKSWKGILIILVIRLATQLAIYSEDSVYCPVFHLFFVNKLAGCSPKMVRDVVAVPRTHSTAAQISASSSRYAIVGSSCSASYSEVSYIWSTFSSYR